jgi:acid phosphatase
MVDVRRFVAAAVAAVALLSGCSASGGPSRASSPAAVSRAVDATAATRPSPAPAAPRLATSTVPHWAHVVVVVMENHGYRQVVGSAQAPYLNRLADTGALLTRSYAITHPSEPNYLALFSGSTHGLTSDACPLTYSGPNLATALAARGMRFAGYSQGLPHQGSTTCYAGAYGRKHNPWSDFTTVPRSANRTLAQFPTDYATLPRVSFVVPDLVHDMHDGTVRQGDTFLRNRLGGYVRWARSHQSLLVVTYDEDERAEDNRIPTVLVGAHVRAGARPTQRVDHYGLLRTIEDACGLRHLGASATRRPIVGIWS